MDITIKIEAPALEDAIHALAVAIAGNIELLLDGPGARANVTETAKNVTNKAETVTETAKNVTKDVETETKTDSTFTLEQVRAKLADLSRGGKQAEVKALLNKLGAKKLTEVPEDKYPELMREAEAI